MFALPTPLSHGRIQPARMELSVILVHYRTPERLHRCLDALESEGSDLSRETVVVDNDPRDGGEIGRASCRERV